ncbi:MAG: YicC/YloC family endoribonuclease, partial [Chitinivibrionales bacterium]
MSIKSMTGFGRSQGDTPSGTYTIELKSVNNRYLDVKFRIPSGLSGLEMKLRKLIKKRVSRGSLTVMVARSSGDGGALTWDKESGDELKSVLSSIADTYSMEDRIDLADFVKMGNLITTSSGTRKISTIWKHIEPLINKALEDFCLSREREGDFMEKDIK